MDVVRAHARQVGQQVARPQHAPPAQVHGHEQRADRQQGDMIDHPVACRPGLVQNGGPLQVQGDRPAFSPVRPGDAQTARHHVHEEAQAAAGRRHVGVAPRVEAGHRPDLDAPRRRAGTQFRRLEAPAGPVEPGLLGGAKQAAVGSQFGETIGRAEAVRRAGVGVVAGQAPIAVQRFGGAAVAGQQEGAGQQQASGPFASPGPLLCGVQAQVERRRFLARRRRGQPLQQTRFRLAPGLAGRPRKRSRQGHEPLQGGRVVPVGQAAPLFFQEGQHLALLLGAGSPPQGRRLRADPQVRPQPQRRLVRQRQLLVTGVG